MEDMRRASLHVRWPGWPTGDRGSRGATPVHPLTPATGAGPAGVEGAAPLVSLRVLPGNMLLDHLSVAQASPRTPSKRALETNSSRRAPDARRRDAGRGTSASQSPEPTKSAAVRWPHKPLIGGGRSSGCDLASLPSEPATLSAAIPFDPAESGSFCIL